MPHVRKVIGNPGTGKTKYLVDHTAALITSGVAPEDIAYLTFTKKATHEAMDRLMALTGRERKEFKWVRTLHSLAFALLGMSKEQMVKEADMGMLLEVVGASDPQEARQLEQMYTYSRIGKIPLMEAWDRMQGSYPVQWTKLLEYDKVYRQYKEHMGRYDFYDLLEQYLATPLVPQLHTVIVDEAQDLSPMQWSIIQLLSAGAQMLMLAGDPHQAIYQWCGADSHILTALPGEEIILPRSNRIPAEVQAVSRCILSRFSDPDRYPYEPASHAGKVRRITRLHMPALALHDGTWMFLARNETFLSEIRTFLFESGIAFECRGSAWSMQTDQKLLRHIEWYNEWLATGEITPSRQAKLRNYCSDPARCATKNLPWQEAFDALPARDKKYYESCRNGDSSRIILSTIHGSKGGEADNVVLFGDYTRAVAREFERNSEQEWACLYVGVTRAKKNLYLVQPERQLGYNWEEILA
jgi:superfamily I DNA/RNA helicase